MWGPEGPLFSSRVILHNSEKGKTNARERFLYRQVLGGCEESAIETLLRPTPVTEARNPPVYQFGRGTPPANGEPG